jgi:hypothetical protein
VPRTPDGASDGDMLVFGAWGPLKCQGPQTGTGRRGLLRETWQVGRLATLVLPLARLWLLPEVVAPLLLLRMAAFPIEPHPSPPISIPLGRFH